MLLLSFFSFKLLFYCLLIHLLLCLGDKFFFFINHCFNGDCFDKFCFDNYCKGNIFIIGGSLSMATVLIATVSQVHFFNRYCFDSYWICFDNCYSFTLVNLFPLILFWKLLDLFRWLLPFPEVAVQIDTQAFGTLVSDLEQRKVDFHVEMVEREKWISKWSNLLQIILLCFSSKGDPQFWNIGIHPGSSEVWCATQTFPIRYSTWNCFTNDNDIVHSMELSQPFIPSWLWTSFVPLKHYFSDSEGFIAHNSPF